jgi:ferric-dicitrate binding protein FerR (iron transport regulator)/tetratricopeptide (TPR) repeat protein
VTPFVHDGGPTQEALFAFVAGRLHPEAAGWIGSHVESCARCQEIMARIDAVRDALEPPPEPRFMRQADLAAVRKRLEHQPWPWSRMAWGTLLGMAAGLVLVLGLRIHQHRLNGRTELARAESGGVGCTIVSRQGDAELLLGDDHQVAQAKLALPVGGALAVAPESRALLRWGGARVAVEGGTTGARVQLTASRSQARELRLERGRVVLDVDPLAVGAELAVLTPEARVTVHGTRFLVESSAAGTTVAVDRGRVRVGRRTQSIEVTAGQRLGPGTLAVTGLLPEDTARLEALEPTWIEGPSESLDVLSDVPGALVDVDGVAYGRAPLSIALAPGVHLVRVRAAGRLPVEERVEVVAGTPTLFHAELPEPAAVVDEPAEPAEPARAAGHATHAPKPSGPNAREVLAKARADVLAGSYERAIERLDELQLVGVAPVQQARAALLEAQAERLLRRPERALPLYEMVARGDGPEAEQAQFMLGQTLGRDLRDPARAAAAFAESQRRFSKGIFAEEAAFRRGEALLHAGDTRAGLEALERYLRQFPSAAHADDAHLYVAEARRDRLGDCAGALPHLKAVADGRGPRAESALIGAARCLGKIGRGDEARSVWKRYLDAQPHGRYADEARAAVGTAKSGQ